jgi:hypothetical protein
MTYVPIFKNAEDSKKFFQTFQDVVNDYDRCFSIVRRTMLPGTLADNGDLSGDLFTVLNDITSNLLYQTRHDIFEKLHPEYKEEDNVFIPHKSLKEKVKEALDEFHRENDS